MVVFEMKRASIIITPDELAELIHLQRTFFEAEPLRGWYDFDRNAFALSFRQHELADVAEGELAPMAYYDSNWRETLLK